MHLVVCSSDLLAWPPALAAAGAARAPSGSTFCWTIALPHAGTCHGGTSPSLGTDPYGVLMSRPRLPQVSVDRAPRHSPREHSRARQSHQAHLLALWLPAGRRD